ncbi:histidine kinase [Mucilaginibacter sp. PAMB04168]|uniref:sensor histidine kinase n=1 Tax=Mucilaginibacter sp. PAMB04168 TaxID=3138567 RepID=UPI0031F68F38
MSKPVIGYLINDLLVIITLFCTRFLGHYRIPMTITALVTYFIVYDWIRNSGLIYSSNVSILHMYLLCAIWADKRYGWWAILSNLIIFVFIYNQTLHAGLDVQMQRTLGGPFYALVMNCLITIFFGGFLAYLQFDQERDRLKIENLKEQKITMLDEAVKKRTEQLNNMRETIATDFHDETGNMLSAITRQASLLKQKFGEQQDIGPIVESIIKNSNGLYASSKDFLWHLNHDSDNPQELFDYMTAYGQFYYNQFDIAFSSSNDECPLFQLAPSAALNIIYIFKEAMTNVVKHAEAREVLFEMRCCSGQLTYSIQDDGNWKAADINEQHYGLANMEWRCQKNGFEFTLSNQPAGTRIEITVPTSTAV